MTSRLRTRSRVRRMLHQRGIKIWMGGFKDILIMSFVWVSIINFVLVSAIAYNTTIRPSLPDSFSWLTPWVFMVLMGVVFVVIMFIEWKWIYPSYYAFRNRQEYEHQNLLRGDLEELKKRQKKIMERLNIEDEED